MEIKKTQWGIEVLRPARQVREIEERIKSNLEELLKVKRKGYLKVALDYSCWALHNLNEPVRRVALFDRSGNFLRITTSGKFKDNLIYPKEFRSYVTSSSCLL